MIPVLLQYFIVSTWVAFCVNGANVLFPVCGWRPFVCCTIGVAVREKNLNSYTNFEKLTYYTAVRRPTLVSSFSKGRSTLQGLLFLSRLTALCDMHARDWRYLKKASKLSLHNYESLVSRTGCQLRYKRNGLCSYIDSQLCGEHAPSILLHAFWRIYFSKSFKGQLSGIARLV